MDWHDFKVLSIYAVLVCIFLFIIGEEELAIVALIGYMAYGFIESIKKHMKNKKAAKRLDTAPEYIKGITISHIMKRNPKLNKREEKRIITDILNSNYKIETFRLTDKTAVADNEPDGGYDYFFTFDSKDRYQVISGTYDKARIGDVLYVVTTPTAVMKVICSDAEYFNMFTC